MKKTKRYFSIFVVLMAVEIAIALFHVHRFVRGFLGDLLVIPLLYYFLRTLFSLSLKKTLIIVLFIAVTVELLQWIDITNHLGVHNKTVNLIFGNTFDPWDLLAYGVGSMITWIVETKFEKRKNNA